MKNCKIEGKESSDWKLVDGIDLIVHIFNPEKRKFYDLRKNVVRVDSQRKSNHMTIRNLFSINLYFIFLS